MKSRGVGDSQRALAAWRVCAALAMNGATASHSEGRRAGDVAWAVAIGVVAAASTAAYAGELRLYWPAAHLDAPHAFYYALLVYCTLTASAVAILLSFSRWWQGALVGLVLGTGLLPVSGIPDGWVQVLSSRDALRQLGVAFVGVLSAVGSIASGVYGAISLSAGCWLFRKQRSWVRPNWPARLALTSAIPVPYCLALALLNVLVPYGVDSALVPSHALYWFVAGVACGFVAAVSAVLHHKLAASGDAPARARHQ